LLVYQAKPRDGQKCLIGGLDTQGHKMRNLKETHNICDMLKYKKLFTMKGGIRMATDNISEPESDLPNELGKPARRALLEAGYLRLEQLTKLSEAEVLKLHGMGPKAIEPLRRALMAKGLAFAEGS
jgi:methyl coenzyme M reductase gamma subunit